MKTNMKKFITAMFMFCVMTLSVVLPSFVDAKKEEIATRDINVEALSMLTYEDKVEEILGNFDEYEITTDEKTVSLDAVVDLSGSTIVNDEALTGDAETTLKKYSVDLDIENPNHFCFVCGKQTESNELAIDHVIPWSYMYSDVIWNLVYVCQHCNSVKSNVIPSKNQIDRLKERNNNLLNILEKQNVSNKLTEELKIAIEKDYVNKFWTGCKG